jgi:GNAT superfamily N-acetyltransferase
MGDGLILHPLAASDHDAWWPLWKGYLHFYRTRLDDAVTRGTWERLIAPDVDIHGIVAEQDGLLLGLTHYLFHPNTWSLEPVCYLEDLFVDPQARGLGAGRKLIEAVYAAADARGASRTYWMTQEYNAEARALYDTLATRTSFVQYRR